MGSYVFAGLRIWVLVTKLGQSYRKVKVIKFWKVKVSWGGMRSTECPSSYKCIHTFYCIWIKTGTQFWPHQYPYMYSTCITKTYILTTSRLGTGLHLNRMWYSSYLILTLIKASQCRSEQTSHDSRSHKPKWKRCKVVILWCSKYGHTIWNFTDSTDRVAKRQRIGQINYSLMSWQNSSACSYMILTVTWIWKNLLKSEFYILRD